MSIRILFSYYEDNYFSLCHGGHHPHSCSSWVCFSASLSFLHIYMSLHNSSCGHYLKSYWGNVDTVFFSKKQNKKKYKVDLTHGKYNPKEDREMVTNKEQNVKRNTATWKIIQNSTSQKDDLQWGSCGLLPSPSAHYACDVSIYRRAFSFFYLFFLSYFKAFQYRSSSYSTMSSRGSITAC